ncbi:MAG: metallophosphoesterase [Lachnospiraceae bacterium]|jgi:calcineurin-like phosphoesterase family protein|nr:Calcineurin-like phosphoesterase superfamily protein [Lachnospiraceae bacterium XPB1003]
MARYYIADLHFYHEAMNERMDCRGFGSVEEMNEYMISRWNDRVRKNDEVVILGDLSMEKSSLTMELIKRLKGKKMLIEGNHDRYLRESTFDRSLFEWVKPYAEMHDNGRKVILSHYPIFCYNGQYKVTDKGKPRTYMLYGHVHNTYDEELVMRFQKETRLFSRPVYGKDEDMTIPCNMINCFCIFSDYTPLSLDEWIEVQKKREAEAEVK